MAGMEVDRILPKDAKVIAHITAIRHFCIRLRTRMAFLGFDIEKNWQ